MANRFASCPARCAGLLAALMALAAGARAGEPENISLLLTPEEASGVLAVQNKDLLTARKWDVAFWVVGDEGAVEDNLLLVGHKEGADEEEGWDICRVKVKDDDDRPGTDDAEALCRKGNRVYIIGSHFGKKAGPLKKKRQFLARFREDKVDHEAKHPTIKLEARRDGFRLHRAINDKLASSGIALIERTAQEIEALISKTIEDLGDENDGRVKEGDWPLNIEGACFVGQDTLLLGFRYPVTKAGHPIIVELANVDELIEHEDRQPSITRVWVLDGVGTEALPTGIRALEPHGDKVYAITGNLDSQPRKSVILAGHPAGANAKSAHRWCRRPQAGVARSRAELVYEFDVQDVEGIGLSPSGRTFYIRDVGSALRFLPD